MANGRTRSSGIFSGLLLVLVGALLLVHNYRGADLVPFLTRWWPLLLILLGVVKLYERTAGRPFGEPTSSRISAQELFLIVGMLALIGAVVGFDMVKGRTTEIPGMGENFSFDVTVEPKIVPPNSRILIQTARGDITVHS